MLCADCSSLTAFCPAQLNGWRMKAKKRFVPDKNREAICRKNLKIETRQL
jgi:hypothetical protein